MKKIVYAIVIMFCFVNMRCEPNDEGLKDSDNLLIGHWAEPEYTDQNVTFSRVNKLPAEGYGISFKTKNDFVERSSGWCGTPPLSFSDYQGKWELMEDVITITQDHFPNNYGWRIVSLTENELVLTKELTEQEKDYRALMDLFDDALDLIKDIPCGNSEDWSFTPYGSKACGGPQWFIAYPNTIDTEEFLSKIEAYTKAEHDYNVKWSVFSTCDVVSPPKEIVCENGFPILKF
ncbi:hypothetical protein EYD45_11440 [Hyunsoonleella flava]|uniref:Lipocalin-like domain-containing protein n=1 Tax=Hyunsoonleella flava TaxID=2527939 RepID=A0A4Q9FFM2_9FLAO|nr:lipocalin family protein [Hyunsoonleella flava]TBN02731.1 hypothetical protein EYD45_11440 [Hyunsoonleella flava]